jgi:hypothetical protein
MAHISEVFHTARVFEPSDEQLDTTRSSPSTR